MSDIEDLLNTIDEGLDENHDGGIRGVPTVGEKLALSTREVGEIMERVEVRPVAEWYEARCLGADGTGCNWTIESEHRHNMLFDAVLHVATTGHQIHIDTSNVESVLPPGEE